MKAPSLRQFLSMAFQYLRTAGRLFLLNTGLRRHEFFILPLSPLGGSWAVRKKSGSRSSWSFLRLRLGTSDFKTFSQVFLQEAYRLSHLPHWGGIQLEYERLLAGGKTPLILDCGANVGLSAVYFNHLFPEARVLAVEPQRGNFDRLRASLAGSRSRPILGAVSSRDGAVKVLDPGLGQDTFRTQKRRKGSPGALPAYSIRRLIQEGQKEGPAVPFLIKIDIEGTEKDLFSSNTGWIPSFKVMAIELHDRYFPGTSNSANFLRAIAKAPRDLLQSDKNLWSVRNDRKDPRPLS